MAQGHISVARTDLAAGIAADTDTTKDLGPSGLNLVPDGGAAIVVLRVNAVNEGNDFAAWNPDTSDTIVVRQPQEDWATVWVSIPTSGANKNKINIRVTNTTTQIEIFAYAPVAGAFGLTNLSIFTPTALDTFETKDMAGDLDGSDTPSLLFLAIRETSFTPHGWTVRHPDRTDAEWNDVWTNATTEIHIADDRIYVGAFVVPKQNGAAWEFDVFRSAVSITHALVGYLKTGFYDQVLTGNPRPDSEFVLDDNGASGPTVIDMDSGGLDYITEATVGIFVVSQGNVHISGWYELDLSDSYPGNSSCDLGRPSTPFKAAMYHWVPINASNEIRIYNEGSSAAFAPHGHAIDGAGAPPAGIAQPGFALSHTMSTAGFGGLGVR